MPHQIGEKHGFTHGHNEGDRIEIYGGDTQIRIIKDKYNTSGNGLTYKVIRGGSDRDFYFTENREKGIIDLPGYVLQSLGIGGKKRHQRYRTSGDDSRYLWAGGKFNSAIRIVDGKREVYDNTVGRFVPIENLPGFKKKGQNYTVIMPGDGNKQAINEYNEAIENEGKERRNVRKRRLVAQNQAEVARLQRKIDPYLSTEDLLKVYNKQVAAYNSAVRAREIVPPVITASMGPVVDTTGILKNKYQATFNEIQVRNNELPEESRISLPIPGQKFVPKEKPSHFQPFILPDGYPPLTDYDYSKHDLSGKSYYPEPGSMESIAAWGFKGLENLDLGIDYSKMNKYPSAFGGPGPRLSSTEDQTINVENTGSTKEEISPKIVDVPTTIPIFPTGVRYREGTDAYNRYNLRIQQ